MLITYVFYKNFYKTFHYIFYFFIFLEIRKFFVTHPEMKELFEKSSNRDDAFEEIMTLMDKTRKTEVAEATTKKTAQNVWFVWLLFQSTLFCFNKKDALCKINLWIFNSHSKWFTTLSFIATNYYCVIWNIIFEKN